MNHPSSRVALVTGANKGIGLEITRQLARRGFRVFLGARDPGRGQAAVARLQGEEAGVAAGAIEFLFLDVADPASIVRAAGELRERTGGRLDVLVNNAAILEDEPGEGVLSLDPARLARTLETNVFGPLRLTQAVADLLAAATPGGARVVNLSSGLGQLHDMGGMYPAYSISKTALNALTRQLAAAFRQRGQAVSVNTMCPGWVKTDMGGAGADREVEQGADTAVWLATEAPADLTGRSWRDREEIPW